MSTIVNHRIIPTCVGKSKAPGRYHLTVPDHPHVRGEKANVKRASALPPGSSPRAWGKVPLIISVPYFGRIIPTCVGKRGWNSEKLPLVSDHPHVRGEKITISSFSRCVNGSSPRAWGKVTSRFLLRCSKRIIPTCVGKSRTENASAHGYTDHPHVRGEKTINWGLL